MEILILIGFGFLIVLLVTKARNDRTKWNREFDKMLESHNFRRCSESQNYAEKTIKKLFQPDIALTVRKPSKAVLKGREVHFFKMYVEGTGRPTLIISDIFMFPLNCKTDRHFIFFMKSDCYRGLAYSRDIVASVYLLESDFEPDRLVELEAPECAAPDDVLFVFGEEGSSPDSLHGPLLLNCIAEAGKYGFFAFYYKDGMASLITLERYEKSDASGISWEEQWAYIQELMRLSAKN